MGTLIKMADGEWIRTDREMEEIVGAVAAALNLKTSEPGSPIGFVHVADVKGRNLTLNATQIEYVHRREEDETRWAALDQER